MKLIIADFLRRWWGGYLLAALFVGTMAAVMNFEASFTFVGILMLPFAFEQGRTAFGVMKTLPVSRRTIALSYWSVGVLLPVILMTVSIALVSLLFVSSGISLKDVAMTLFGSLAFAGSVFCMLTFVSGVKGWSDFLVICLGTLWFWSVMFSSFHQEFLAATTQSPVVYLVALIGLLLTVWGYSRSEKLLFGRTTKYPADGQYHAQSSKRIPAPKKGMARFGGVFFEVARSGFLFGLFYFGLLALFKIRPTATDEKSDWPFLFMFGGMGGAGLFSGGVRLLRSVPLSVGHLALNLMLMPLFSILAAITGVAVIQWLNLGHFLSSDSANFLIPMTGAICFASSFMVRHSASGNGYIVAMALGFPASWVVFDTVAHVKWPAAFWRLLGLGLIAAAFFLNRHWLRSSASYRPSAASSQRR